MAAEAAAEAAAAAAAAAAAEAAAATAGASVCVRSESLSGRSAITNMITNGFLGYYGRLSPLLLLCRTAACLPPPAVCHAAAAAGCRAPAVQAVHPHPKR